MKKTFAVALFAALLLPVVAAAQQSTAYHIPQTGAEKALENLFILQQVDKDFMSAALNDFIPGYNPRKAQKHASLFTAALAAKYREVSLGLYQRCGANRSRLCFEPPAISCSMNMPIVVSYRSISDNGRIAQVAYSMNGKADGAQYRMVNENGTWKLDDFSCLNPTP